MPLTRHILAAPNVGVGRLLDPPIGISACDETCGRGGRDSDELTGAGEPAVQSSVLVGVGRRYDAPLELLGCSSRQLGQHLFQCRLIGCDEGLR